MTPKPPQPALRLRSVFISDVHLGFKGCRAEFLLDFLRRVECEQIYLVGDIIDLWSLQRSFLLAAGTQRRHPHDSRQGEARHSRGVRAGQPRPPIS